MQVEDQQAPAELLSIPQAARRLGIGRKQLDRAIREGELGVVVLGWPRVSLDELRAWVASRRRTRG